jgi:hypothetical protein
VFQIIQSWNIAPKCDSVSLEGKIVTTNRVEFCRARSIKGRIVSGPDFLRAQLFVFSIVYRLNCASQIVQGRIVWGRIVQGRIVPVRVFGLTRFRP